MNTLKQDLAAHGHPFTPWHIAYALIFSSGFLTICLFRLYSPLYKYSKITRIPAKIIERLAQIITNCYLEPTATIAPGLHLPHATGIVVGANVIIGANVTLYQHTTLGRKSKTKPSAPTIGANSIIYAGAVIAGDVKLPANTIIPAGAIITQTPPKRIAKTTAKKSKNA